jgi:hypothetical protein
MATVTAMATATVTMLQRMWPPLQVVLHAGTVRVRS